MHIGIPQAIVIVFLLIALGVNLGKDGEPRTGHHSFGVTFVGACIHVGLLYWGGFFA